MGKPNFARLAELGQLPDYAKPSEEVKTEKSALADKTREHDKKVADETAAIKEVAGEKFDSMLKKDLIVEAKKLGLPSGGTAAEIKERLKANAIDNQDLDSDDKSIAEKGVEEDELLK